MKKRIAIIGFLFCTISMFSQSSLKSFFDLSGPKRTWVFFHPFKAKKSLAISKETNKVAASIGKSDLLDGDASGGQVDAFRHAYWMARLSQEIGESAARSLGKAHEKENYLTFKNNKLEDGIVPDEISSEMDLYNNEQGLKLVSANKNMSKEVLINTIVKAIKSGKMKIIKKDNKGNFLNADGKPISKQSLKGKWKNNKVLVSSK